VLGREGNGSEHPNIVKCFSSEGSDSIMGVRGSLYLDMICRSVRLEAVSKLSGKTFGETSLRWDNNGGRLI
jgi:hypothetical protein